MYFAEPAGQGWAVFWRPEPNSRYRSMAIDYFRSQGSAAHAASVLNRGAAIVEAHRTVGCRVQPLANSRRPAAA